MGPLKDSKMGKGGQSEGDIGAFTSLNNPDFALPLCLSPGTSHTQTFPRK